MKEAGEAEGGVSLWTFGPPGCTESEPEAQEEGHRGQQKPSPAASFGCWILFLNEGRGRKAKKTGEPVLREVWKSQGAGGKEGLPEEKL